MPNILDLASPEPIKADEHIHPVEHMTVLDHLIIAFYIAIVTMGWIGIGMVIATLFHLPPLGRLVVIVAWPIALVPLILLITEVILPLGRLIRQKAERIEGYND